MIAKPQNFLFLFLFSILLIGFVSAGASNPDPENIDASIPIGTADFENFTQNYGAGIYINPVGDKLFLPNITDILVFDIPTPFDITTINTTANAPHSVYSLAGDNHRIKFDYSGIHAYIIDRGDLSASGTDTEGTLSHYVLTTPFDLSTATFSESLTNEFGICDVGTKEYNYWDSSVLFSGSKLFLFAGCWDVSGNDNAYKIREYDLSPSYYLTSPTEVYTQEEDNTGFPSSSNYSGSLAFTFPDSFYFSITSGTIEQNRYVGIDAYDLSTFTINKTLTNKYRGIYVTPNTDYYYLKSAVYNINDAIVRMFGFTPLASNELTGTYKIEVNKQSQININDYYAFSSNPNWESNVIITKSGIVFDLMNGDSNVSNIGGTEIANFSLNGNVLSIDTNNITTTYEVSMGACIINTSVCGYQNFFLEIIEGFGEETSIVFQPQDVDLEHSETIILNLTNNFEFNEDYVFIAIFQDLIDTDNHDRIVTNDGSKTSITEDLEIFDSSGNLIIDASFSGVNGEILTIRSYTEDYEFNVYYRYCDNTQTFPLSFCTNTNTYELTIFDTIHVSDSGVGILSSVTFVGGLFPDSDELSLSQRSVYVILSLIGILVLVILFGFLLKDSLGVKTTSPLIFVGALLEFLAFFYFVAIGYIGVGVLISGILIIALLVIFGLWKGRGA